MDEVDDLSALAVRESRRPAWSYWARLDVGGRRKEMRAEWSLESGEVVFVFGGASRGAWRVLA